MPEDLGAETIELNQVDMMLNNIPNLLEFRIIIEERYKQHPTGAGNSFDEILCYEIHHGSDGEHEGGLTFSWLAKKWNISLPFLGELISDHCRGLAEGIE